ncbi:MAG: hypothetical protein V4474_01500 [Patescibacteria group bacterium]
MWKTIKTIVGLGIGAMIVYFIAVQFFLPIATSPNPGRAMDRTTQGFLNWLASPAQPGDDARIVSFAFVIGLIFFVLWLFRKIAADGKKTFSKAKPKKKKPRRVEIIDDDDDHH